MKVIPLSQGKSAVIDDEDFELIAGYGNWFCVVGDSGICYAAHSEPSGVTVLMHRVILGLKKGQQGDHVNGDGLDNRRINLRIATSVQNLANSGLRKDNTSGCKGVSWRKKSKSWRVQMRKDGKVKHLGYYKSLDVAIAVYDAAMKEQHGEFARTNHMLGTNGVSGFISEDAANYT